MLDRGFAATAIALLGKVMEAESISHSHAILELLWGQGSAIERAWHHRKPVAGLTSPAYPAFGIVICTPT